MSEDRPILIDLAKLERVTTLYAGSHVPDGHHCVMEAVAYVAGEPWSDTPACVSPVIAAFLQRWNDDLTDDATRTRLLRPLIVPMIGTAGGDEVALAWMATDWLARTCVPAWLRPTLADHARALESLPPLTTAETAEAARPVLLAAGAAAEDAAWAAAGDTAWAAAGDAAWAAAGAAAWAAAWNVAWAAARAAAWAAAGDTAWAPAAARLQLTTEWLQSSAVELVLRMCAVATAAPKGAAE